MVFFPLELGITYFGGLMVEIDISWTQVEVKAIREQLSRVLHSAMFAQSGRQCRFLKYVVEATLAGRADRLNQFLIGLEVFDRDESFDPATDSIVRVEAGRLRSKLHEYYSELGQKDPVLIELPKGGYAVRIQTKLDKDRSSDATGNIGSEEQSLQSIHNDEDSSQTLSDAPASAWVSVGLKITPIVLLSGLVVGAIYLGFFTSTEIESMGDVSSTVKTPSADYPSEGVTQSVERGAEKPTIAILPFDNMSNDPEQEYFSDGITEDIITDLSKVSGLFVIARHSTFIYKEKPLNIKEISKELGVRYILEGSVRKAGDRLRITAQLIDARTENHLWAERYDRKLDDIFAIQDDVSRKIVNALEVKLTGMDEKRLGHKGTNNVEAHDFFLRGQEQFYLFTSEGINNSIELFSKAIELDPDYAEAYAWKSRVITYTFIAGLNNSIKETIDPALALARKAIELDELLPMAHANLGWALRWNQKFEEAIVEANKAVELDANFADGYLWQSMILSPAGRGQEALASIEKGIRINPYYSVTYIFALGYANLTLGQYEKALYYFERSINRNPNFIHSYIYKMFVLELLGKNEEAEAAKNELMQIYPDHRFSASYLFYMDERSNKSLDRPD